ncbi:MAG TPA: protein kinase [Gemmatimonadaceae bacterium]|nr:protein kinase [Gemmatimonadaceae bacterium]
MTAPERVADAAPPMTPERWRAVDAILQAALEREPARRDAFVADACAGDESLRREVDSLLAAHDRAGGDFLERPAAEALDAPGQPPLTERLAGALEGRYALEHELARGGMATVHLARDLRHGRRVAIKVLREELAAAVGAERFLEEIRVTASLQHPHILPLFDSGSADRVLWYVMPFVEGETLRSRLAREGRLPVNVALQLAREIADALEYAHRHGVVHRDVKPENVLLQSGHALVADFGIALALEHAGGDRLTRTGITLGTPQYMAPEQAAGDGAIDARTDVYALGAVLHEMLAGESPFAAGSQQEMLRRVLHEPPTALATRRADVSSFLDGAVRQALAKRPDDRFPSAAAFAAALALPSGGTESGASASANAPSAEPRGRSAADAHERTERGRRVSARAATYAASATLVIGLVGGWALARSSAVERWTSATPDFWQSTFEARVAPSAMTGATSLTILDRAGRPLRTIAADRPWTPRFSPDGRRLAYGAFGAGRRTSDLWILDLDEGTTRRFTDDADDSNDPQWSADGAMIAYSANAPRGKDLLLRKLGGTTSSVLARREGTQFPSDWARDGSALLVTEEAGPDRHDILVQPTDGSTPSAYAATSADETAARISPDGRWVAYTSDHSGRPEVYLDSYPTARRPVAVSSDGGAHPVWRGDGRELYYWHDGALVAVRLGASSGDAPPVAGARTVLFRAPYQVGVNTMYDVSPDGERFVIVPAPSAERR